MKNKKNKKSIVDTATYFISKIYISDHAQELVSEGGKVFSRYVKIIIKH